MTTHHLNFSCPLKIRTVKAKNCLRIAALLSSLAGFLFVQSAHGDNATWINAQGNHNWNDSGNWNPATLPNASSDVLINIDSGVTIQSGNQGIANILRVGAGEGGNAHLTISGTLTTAQAIIGQESFGTVNVDGGHWTNTLSTIQFGQPIGARGGGGTLDVRNGGIFTESGTVFLGTHNGLNGATGTIIIGGDANQADIAAPGVIDAPVITSGITSSDPLGTVQFNHTGTDYWFTRNGLSTGTGVAINGSVQVIQNAGHTSLKAANNYTMGTFLNGGELSITDNNQLGDISSAVHFDGGTLGVTSNGADFFGSRQLIWGEKGGGFDIDGILLVTSTLSGGTLRMGNRGLLNLQESANLAGVELGAVEGETPAAIDFAKSSTIGNLQFDNGGRIQSEGDLTISSLSGTGGELRGNNFFIGSGSYDGFINVGSTTKTGTDTLTLVGVSHSQYSLALNVNGGTLRLTGILEESVNSEFGNVAVSGNSLLDVQRVGTTHVDSLAVNGAALHLSGTGVILDISATGNNTIAVTNGQILLARGAELRSAHSDISLDSSSSLDIGEGPGEEAAAAGVLTLDPGHKITGSGTVSFHHTGSLAFSTSITGSNSVTKSGSGTTTLTGEQSYTGSTFISEGTLILNTSIASSSLTAVTHGGTLAGSGTVGALEVRNDGILSPGNSPGKLTAGDTLWDSGGKYIWQIDNATGIKGTNWDLLDVVGGLDLADIGSTNPFTINVVSLGLDGNPGEAANFDPLQDYTWEIASTSSGIEGFDADKFNINVSGFLNAPDPSHFSLSSDGSNIDLKYSAVPEPATSGLFAAGGILLVLIVLRTRQRRLA